MVCSIAIPDNLNAFKHTQNVNKMTSKNKLGLVFFFSFVLGLFFFVWVVVVVFTIF